MSEVEGLDNQYAEKLKQEALRQKECFFEKQGNTRIDDIVAMMKKKSGS
jgi:hypothetical protein